MTTKATPKEDYVRNGQVIRVIDGDTAEFCVDLGCNIRINMTCRFNGINAPEVKTDEGKKAKAWMEQQLLPGMSVTIKTFKGDSTEKYGRYLADVYRQGDTKSLNAQAVEQGYAVTYSV
jgi:endonuclease YncB( thermonuclease family)